MFRVIKLKTKTKKINCESCGKNFNKQETFDKHMIVEHKKIKTVTQANIGRSDNMKINK